MYTSQLSNTRKKVCEKSSVSKFIVRGVMPIQSEGARAP